MTACSPRCFTEHPVQREVLIYIHTGDRQHFQSFQKLPINRFDLLRRDSGENDPSPLILFSRDSCTLLKALLTNAIQVTIHARATNALQRYKVRRQHRAWQLGWHNSPVTTHPVQFSILSPPGALC